MGGGGEEDFAEGVHAAADAAHIGLVSAWLLELFNSNETDQLKVKSKLLKEFYVVAALQTCFSYLMSLLIFCIAAVVVMGRCCDRVRLYSCYRIKLITATVCSSSSVSGVLDAGAPAARTSRSTALVHH